MRRQARPFVTEYRASGRRGKDGSQPSGRIERETSRATEPPDLFAAPFNAPPVDHFGEDSYEAALRAADALFSSPRSSEPAVPAKPRPAAAPPRPTAAVEAVFSSPPPPAPLVSEALEPGGRILRAIEEPDDDRFAALEAERAPKRRGRKPGSKNKPKVPAFGTAVPSPLIDPIRAYQMPIEVQPAVQTGLIVEVRRAPSTPALAFRSPPSPSVVKVRDRFAWVRTKLRPGEKWKRRLPKVAW